MKTKNRILSLILGLALVVSSVNLFPITVYAFDPVDTSQPPTTRCPWQSYDIPTADGYIADASAASSSGNGGSLPGETTYIYGIDVAVTTQGGHTHTETMINRSNKPLSDQEVKAWAQDRADQQRGLINASIGDPRDIVTTTHSVKGNGREAGVQIYYTEVPVSRPATLESAANGLAGQVMSGELVGFTRYISGSHTYVLTGTEMSMSAFNLLFNSGVSSMSNAEIIDLVARVDPGRVERVSKALANYQSGVTNTLPAYYAVPVIASANGNVDALSVGCNPISSSPDIGVTVGQALDAAAGDSSMGYLMMTAQTSNGTTNPSVEMMPNNMYIASGYALLGTTGGIPLPPDSTIYAYGKPKMQTVKWTKNPTQTGSYTVKVNVTNKQIGYTDGIAKIEVTSDFTGSQWNELSQSITSVKVSGINHQYVKEESASRVYLEIPVAIISDWNSFGQIEYTVNVTGGHDSNAEEKVGALFKAQVTVNGTTIQATPMKWPGMENVQDVLYPYTRTPNVQEYVSFIGTGGIPPKDKPYDKHSTISPIGTGHLVANAYDENDWDVATGIPSTENVTAGVGAEIAMYDITGYLCVRNNMEASSVGLIDVNVGDIDDTSGTNIGTPQTSQAVDRLITINSKVINCWGGSNFPDQLSRTALVNKSGGDSHQTITESHSVINSGTDTCPGDTCGNGSYGWEDWKLYGWPADRCSVHTNVLRLYLGERTASNPGHSCGDVEEGEEPNKYIVTHGGSCRAGTPSECSHSHNCKWHYAVYDALANDHWLGETTGFPDSGSEKYISARGSTSAAGSSYALSYGLIELSTGPDTGVNIVLEVDWKPSQDRQYYVVNYRVYSTTNYTSTAHGTNASGSQIGQPDFVPASGQNSDGVISQDYTHGTGGTVTYYENMVNQGTHVYTMTYHETIDAYAYRTITDSQLYSLTGIKITNIHTIDRPQYQNGIIGLDYEAGTFDAPLSDSAIDKGVSAMDCVGYLFRCCGPNNGEYQDGNGRIEFEAWVDSHACFGGNTSVELESLHEYYLGDVEVNLKTIQDSEYWPTIVNEDTYEADAEAGVPDRGNPDHVNDHVFDHTTYHTTASDTKYESITTGDCTHHAHTTELFEAEHNEAVYKELLVQFNHWCSINKAEDYKANIISDTQIYGGNTGMTSVITDDAHSVDEGLLLFNVVASPTQPHLLNGHGGGGEEQCGETVVYRNHKNKLNTVQRIPYLDELEAGNYSDQDIPDAMNMPTTDTGGGDTSISATTVYSLMTDLAGASASGGSAGYPVHFTKGDGVDEGIYSSVLDPTHSYLTPGSGITKVDVKVTGNASSVPDRSRYWNDHTYYGLGSGIARVTVYGDTEMSSGSNGYNNNGQACFDRYGTLTISNLQLVDWTPNGLWNTGQANAEYIGSNMACSYIPEPQDGWEYNELASKQHLDISNKLIPAPCGDNGGYFNQIYIYDPVTVENDKVVGCQHGSFATGVEDQRMYDQRVDEYNNWLDQNTVDDYVVQSRKLYSWVSPIGNFAMVNAMTGPGPGCNTIPSGTEAGKVYRNAGHRGYVNNMNCERWILNETIAYPFIAGITDMSYAREPYVDIPITAHEYTGTARGMGKGATPQDVTVGDLLYGNKYAVTDTCNLVEKKNATVYYRAFGINCYEYSTDSPMSGSCTAGYSFEQDHNISKQQNGAWKTDDVDLVGSIGNLTIHDTSDFRFSEYFKEIVQPETWLIAGTIHVTDSTKPIKVTSSTKDILYREVAGVTDPYGDLIGHASLGQTLYDRVYRGMAGEFDELPLVPRYNTNENYNKEAMRIGYKVYASVETIGNYQSYIMRGEQSPTGASLTTRDTFPGDTRTNYLDIKSVYYLLDLDTNKFYDIDIWSGSSGSKERLYNGTSHEAEPVSVAGELFQNVNEEHNRRNVSDNLVARQDFHIWTNWNNDSLPNANNPTAVHSDVHYIGNPGHIRLDNRDLYYIGSSSALSLGRAWEQFSGFYSQLERTSQQYHFTEGLTSTSMATIPLGDNPSQQEIRSANQKLMQEHPHAVILELQDFIAKGNVWTIKLRGSVVNTPTLQVYKVGEVPQGYPATASDPITYQNAIVYNPVTGAQTGTINPDLSPLVVMEAYSTSADDRQVAGTH